MGSASLANYSRAIDWMTVTGEKQIAFIADLGIVFLLFFIGMELSMRRMITMRRLVFGLGGLQVVPDGDRHEPWLRCGSASRPAAALIIGACLALSSTAIVMELLSGPASHDVDHWPHQLRHPARPGSRRRPPAVPDQRAGRKHSEGSVVQGVVVARGRGGDRGWV